MYMYEPVSAVRKTTLLSLLQQWLYLSGRLWLRPFPWGMSEIDSRSSRFAESSVGLPDPTKRTPTVFNTPEVSIACLETFLSDS